MRAGLHEENRAASMRHAQAAIVNGQDDALALTFAGFSIGMDGHEPPFLVRNDTTALEAGMCFSDEPGLYIPGQFGIRLEDCWYMTENGPKLFTALAKSLDEPV